jgi:CDP-diacylglycerol--serine O-phosphatidyltransferase
VRGIYIIPNAFTAANLACGFLAIVKLSNGKPDAFKEAAWLILFAIIFDMLDGRVARWTKATSAFGVQFDSLADLVTFGVAPGLLIYRYSVNVYPSWGIVAAFAYVLCGAARLARFNVKASLDTGGPSYFFVGCPIPAAASFLAVSVIVDLEQAFSLGPNIYMGLVLIAAFAMVSTFPYPSFKKRSNRLKKTAVIPLGILLVMFFVLALLTYKMSVLFFFIFAYFLSGPIWRCARLFRLVSSTGDGPKSEAQCEEKSL